MIDTLEIIELINKFKQALPQKAFEYNSPIKLYKIPGYEDRCIMGSIEKLEEYIRTSKDNKISFTDYNQLQEFMQANSLVETGLKFPTVEDIKEINEKAMRTQYQEYYKFYSYYTSLYDTWRSKQKYIAIPPQIQDGLIKKNREYIKIYKNMSPDMKVKFTPILNDMLDPTKLFNLLVSRYNPLFTAMLAGWRNDNRDKAQYLENTYIAIKDIKKVFTPDTMEAVLTIQDWLNKSWIDPKYILNLHHLDQRLLSFANKAIQNENAKREEKRKREEEEMKKKEEAIKADPEKTEKRNKAIEEFEDAYSDNSQTLLEMETKARAYNGTAEHLSVLPTEATVDQLNDLKQELGTLEQQGQQALARLNNISNDIG